MQSIYMPLLLKTYINTVWIMDLKDLIDTFICVGFLLQFEVKLLEEIFYQNLEIRSYLMLL
jgi:hypothetical protein